MTAVGEVVDVEGCAGIVRYVGTIDSSTACARSCLRSC